MIHSDPEFLSLFGWDGSFEIPAAADLVSQSFFYARVIGEERSLYRVQAGLDTVLMAAISGTMQTQAKGRVDYPAVGDWVLAALPDSSGRGVIHHICPRKSLLQRRQVGSSGDQQILSTNIDRVFIATSVNEDLVLARLERYLAVARESGAAPVILLTKADLPGSLEDSVRSVEKEFPEVPVHTLSQKNFAQAGFLEDYLVRGSTSIFIGSSGVGKSTLVNYLTGQTNIKTQAIREGDGKGRHTTTSRNLYVSRYGGLIIDSPGMRELQLSDHAEGVSQQFADVETLLGTCRFSDCQHKTEPGCIIKAALASGSLAEARWLSYQKLVLETRHAKARQGFAKRGRK
jgi:ribosome biogenesis GTPase